MWMAARPPSIPRIWLTELGLDCLSDEVEGVGGLTMGADPVACSRCGICEGRPIPAFLIRKQPKGHGLKSALGVDSLRFQGLHRGHHHHRRFLLEAIEKQRLRGLWSFKYKSWTEEEQPNVLRKPDTNWKPWCDVAI